MNKVTGAVGGAVREGIQKNLRLTEPLPVSVYWTTVYPLEQAFKLIREHIFWKCMADDKG